LALTNLLQWLSNTATAMPCCNANIAWMHTGGADLLLGRAFLSTLTALELLKCSISSFAPLGSWTRATLLLEHLLGETANLASSRSGCLFALGATALLRGSLLVDAAVVHRPLGGEVAPLHQHACCGFPVDEGQHPLVRANITLAMARVDFEATVVADISLAGFQCIQEDQNGKIDESEAHS